MAEQALVPIRIVGGERWGHLSAVSATTHYIVGEDVKVKENYSFGGGHRVRLYSFKNNVHWKIPEGITLNIGAVVPATAAPRRAKR